MSDLILNGLPARPRRGLDLHVPHLPGVEILSVIRQLVASCNATAERGEQAIGDLPRSHRRGSLRSRGHGARGPSRDPCRLTGSAARSDSWSSSG